MLRMSACWNLEDVGSDGVSEQDVKRDQKTETEIQNRESKAESRRLGATFLRLFLGSADASSLDQRREVGEWGAKAHEGMLRMDQLFFVDWNR